MSIVVPTTLDTLVAPVVTGAIAPAPFTLRSVVVPIVAGGGGTESPLKVWNGTEWVALPGPASP